MDVDSHKRFMWTSTSQICLMLSKLMYDFEPWLLQDIFVVEDITRFTKHKSPVLEPQLVAFQRKSFLDLWQLDACL